MLDTLNSMIVKKWRQKANSRVIVLELRNGRTDKDKIEILSRYIISSQKGKELMNVGTAA